jgi:8-oxo-dGTP pyrophosphatase MutT (NUDIX family)
MVDGSGNVRGVAIKELEEECGLVAKPEGLIDLT